MEIHDDYTRRSHGSIELSIVAGETVSRTRGPTEIAVDSRRSRGSFESALELGAVPTSSRGHGSFDMVPPGGPQLQLQQQGGKRRSYTGDLVFRDGLDNSRPRPRRSMDNSIKEGNMMGASEFGLNTSVTFQRPPQYQQNMMPSENAGENNSDYRPTNVNYDNNAPSGLDDNIQNDAHWKSEGTIPMTHTFATRRDRTALATSLDGPKPNSEEGSSV